MKKLIAIMFGLSMICTLTACHRSEDDSVSYSVNLETDKFYNIGAYTSVLSESPVIISDEENDGDVSIRR